MKTIGKKNIDYREIVVMISIACYTCTIEAKNIKEFITDEYWIEAMQDKLQ